MPRRPISASNAVVNAAEQVAAMYRVRYYRMNTRTFTVVGAGGRERPMFMGAWHNGDGIEYRKGMADLLLTPRIRAWPSVTTPEFIAVPLWCECKSGTGRLSKEQILFRDDVIDAGSFYLQLNDAADELLRWFEEHGVRRQ
jgi:hypothetical protein